MKNLIRKIKCWFGWHELNACDEPHMYFCYSTAARYKDRAKFCRHCNNGRCNHCNERVKIRYVKSR